MRLIPVYFTWAQMRLSCETQARSGSRAPMSLPSARVPELNRRIAAPKALTAGSPGITITLGRMANWMANMASEFSSIITAVKGHLLHLSSTLAISTENLLVFQSVRLVPLKLRLRLNSDGQGALSFGHAPATLLYPTSIIGPTGK